MNEKYIIKNRPLIFVTALCNRDHVSEGDTGVILNEGTEKSKLLFCDKDNQPIVVEWEKSNYKNQRTDKSDTYYALLMLRREKYILARDKFLLSEGENSKEFVTQVMSQRKTEYRGDYWEYLFLQQAVLVAGIHPEVANYPLLKEKLNSTEIWIFSQPWKTGDAPNEINLPEFLEDAIESRTLRYRVKCEEVGDTTCFRIQTNPFQERQYPILLTIPERRYCSLVYEIRVGIASSKLEYNTCPKDWFVFDNILVHLDNGISFMTSSEETVSFSTGGNNLILEYSENVDQVKS